MGILQRMMVKDFPYWDINQSKWFADLTEEAYENSERCKNRIYIYFNSKEKAVRCMEKCVRRNIKHFGIIQNIFYKSYRVDILMNWKERRPSRIRKKQEQILD